MASLVITPYDMKSRRCSTVMSKDCLRVLRRIGVLGPKLHRCVIVEKASGGNDSIKGWCDVLCKRCALGVHMCAYEREIDIISIQGVCDFQVCGFSTDSDEMDMVSRSCAGRGPDNVDWPFVVPPPRKIILTSVWFV
jgi:hypothetical protein